MVVKGRLMVELQEIPMFSALEERYISELKNAVHVKHFSKDSIVFYEGDESEYLHILMEGDVKLYKTSPKGSQIQINRFSSPSLIAEFACFEKEVFPATCEFVTGTRTLLGGKQQTIYGMASALPQQADTPLGQYESWEFSASPYYPKKPTLNRRVYWAERVIDGEDSYDILHIDNRQLVFAINYF